MTNAGMPAPFFVKKGERGNVFVKRGEKGEYFFKKGGKRGTFFKEKNNFYYRKMHLLFIKYTFTSYAIE